MKAFYYVSLYPLVVILFAFSSLQVSAKSDSVQILGYGGPGGFLSSDILILLEELSRDPKNRLKVLSTETGSVYRKGDVYLLTHSPKAFNYIERTWNQSEKKKDQVQVIESTRSLMVMPKGVPKALIDLIMARKNKPSNFHGYYRYWEDLEKKSAKVGVTSKGKYRFVDFSRPKWAKDKKWTSSFYLDYKVNFQGKELTLTTLVKEFGSIYRTVPTIKSLRKKNDILLSIGGLTGHELDFEKDRLGLLSELGEQYAVVGERELVGYEKYIKPYLQRWSGDAPIQFLSANIFSVGADGKKKRIFPSHRIIERNGKKIAIVGISSPGFQELLDKEVATQPWMKNIRIEKPTKILETEIFPKIRVDVDLMILVSNLTDKEAVEVENSTSGYDLLVRPGWRTYTSAPKARIVQDNYKVRLPRFPIYLMDVSRMEISQAEIKWKDRALEVGGSRVLLNQDIPLVGEPRLNDTLFNQIFSGKDYVLPDHRKLYPDQVDKIIIHQDEFAKLSSELLRKSTASEVGIVNVRTSGMSLVGDVDASVLKSWISSSDRLVVFYVPGAVLSGLLAEFKGQEDPNKIEVSGIDELGQISGAKISPNHFYRVATTTALIEKTDVFPSLNAIRKKHMFFVDRDGVYREDSGGAQVKVVDMLTKKLKEKWKKTQQLPESERLAVYKNLYEGKMPKRGGYWLHDFKNIRLEYSEVQTTDTGDFGNVIDNRLVSADQRTFGATIDFSSFYRRYPYITEIGLRGAYSKLEIQQADDTFLENILADDLVIFTNIGFPWIKFKKWQAFAAQAGPFVEVAYDTEFEKNEGQSLEQKIQGLIGWKFYDGTKVKSLSVAALNETDLTKGQEKNEWGIASRLEWLYPMYQGKVIWRSDIDYKYFFDSSKDSEADLQHRLTWDNYLDLKVFGKFTFGPYFKYFSFSGKTFDSTGTQTVLGVSLSFSSAWKPEFQSTPF